MRSQQTIEARKAQIDILARQGLRLPRPLLERLKSARIYCQPTISIERQRLTKKYVLRGVESGGAVTDLGAYTGFVGENGVALGWLQRVDSIGINGVHAIVIEPLLIRIEMIRIERTYDVLITRHILCPDGTGARPRLDSSILFYGRRGNLELELWGKDARFLDTVCPVFYTRAGEDVTVPEAYYEAVRHITGAVCCLGCRHSHLLGPRSISDEGQQDGLLQGTPRLSTTTLVFPPDEGRTCQPSSRHLSETRSH